MKTKNLFMHLILASFLFSILSACGKKEKKSEKEVETKKEVTKPDFSAGKAIYEAKCQVCHKADGTGTKGTFPPLANSDYLLANKKRAIKTSLYGTQDPIVVNNVKYSGKAMVVPGGITEQEAMEVINYILNAWGNNGGTVSIEDVKAVVKEHQKK